jgi:uncharacterized protein YciI
LLQTIAAKLRLQHALSQLHDHPAFSLEAIMKFVVLFQDNTSAGVDVRRKHMPEHLAFLQLHSAKVRAAGPLKTADGADAGGLWIVEGVDAAEVDTLVREDPFWPTGLRKSVRILTWSQVFADGRALISL